MRFQTLLSSTAGRRPLPADLLAGEIAIHTHQDSPGVFFKTATGEVLNFGPVLCANVLPSLARGTWSKGEFWWDGKDLRMYDGSDWQKLASKISAKTSGNHASTPTTSIGDASVIFSGTNVPGSNRLAIWNGSQFVDLLQYNTVYSSSTAPTAAKQGDLWVQVTASQRILSVYDSNTWLPLNDKFATIYTTNTQPTSPVEGDLWVDKPNNAVYLWTSNAWFPLFTSNAKVFIADNPPSNPIQGDLWWSSLTGALAVRYNDQWVDALSGSQELNTSAISGGGTNVVISNTAPSNPSSGALWYDTTAGGLKIWNTASWVSVATGQVWGNERPLPIAVSDNPPASPTSGTLWFKSDDGTLLIYYNDGDSAQWVDVLSGNLRTSTEGQVISTVFYSNTAPSNPSAGMTWYSPTAAALYVYTGSAWQTMSSGSGGGGSGGVTVSPSAPADPSTGTGWLNSTNSVNSLQFWNGTAWVQPNSGIAAGGTNPTDTVPNNYLFYNTSTLLLQRRNSGSYDRLGTANFFGATWPTANGAIRNGDVFFDTGRNRLRIGNASAAWNNATQVITYAASAPSNPATGDVHINTSGISNVWNGSSWQPFGGSSVSVTNTQPSSPINGALWFAPVSKQLRVWDSANSRWDYAGSYNIVTPSSGDVTFGAGASPGSLWYQTDTEDLYLYDGVTSQWRLVRRSKPTVNNSNTAPTGGSIRAGDLWYNTALGVLQCATADGGAYSPIDAVVAMGDVAPTAGMPEGYLWWDSMNLRLRMWYGGQWIDPTAGSRGMTATSFGANTLTVANSETAPGDIVTFSRNGTTRFRVDQNGYVILSSLPVAADNAAANTAGVPVGGLYRTSTGELRIRI